MTFYPLPSDALHLTGYGLLGLGFLAMVRRRRSSGDFTALLDASIVAAGVGVMAAVFVLEPILHDPGLSALGKFVSAAYPVMDVVLIGLLVRLWVTPSPARRRSRCSPPPSRPRCSPTSCGTVDRGDRPLDAGSTSTWSG